MRTKIRFLLLFLPIAVSCSTPTEFYGSPKVGEGPVACADVCAKQGLEARSFVMLGEYSSGCLCELTEETKNEGVQLLKKKSTVRRLKKKNRDRESKQSAMDMKIQAAKDRADKLEEEAEKSRENSLAALAALAAVVTGSGASAGGAVGSAAGNAKGSKDSGKPEERQLSDSEIEKLQEQAEEAIKKAREDSEKAKKSRDDFVKVLKDVNRKREREARVVED